MKALVTGGEGGLGRAIRARLEAEGYDVESLDLVTGFDVSDPAAWERIGPVDVACLNAGVLTGAADPRELTVDRYRRAVAVNVDGVVLGVMRLARVMARGSIVVTASLAGLTAMPSDPVYSLTKHALVGFVRSAAPLLAPLRLNAVCPGIADTPMIDAQRDAFAAAGFPLLAPEEVAEAVWLAATSPGTGECWFVQPGREPGVFRFPSVPGPRRGGERVGEPPETVSRLRRETVSNDAS
ncbi:MAG TPA: SDR family NAD(P)-dependent oxidoreductase [Gaiellaceae bacterium]|nr:SDR family NAD(P)-dependent oxidoreductase [Gaiellaceae bacterium]